MAGVSEYRILRPLAVGAQDNAWSASDGADRLVLERCDPSDLWTREEAGDALGLFLARRALQKRLAGKAGGGTGLGLGHVVHVRDLGVDESGGYAVCEAYDLTVGDLIRNRVSPAAWLLHEIVAGALTALGAVEAYGGRPHGDLDGDALLIRDMQPRSVQVGICDPLPAHLLDADLDSVRRDELHRLGLLIYELVMRRPFPELGGYQVLQDGPEWRSLGAHHEFWRRLVNDLLDPTSDRLTLRDVVTRVGGLKYIAPKKPRPRTKFGVFAAVVLIGAAAAFMSLKGPPIPQSTFLPEEFVRWVRVSPGVRLLHARADERKAVSAVFEDVDRLLDGADVADGSAGPGSAFKENDWIARRLEAEYAVHTQEQNVLTVYENATSAGSSRGNKITELQQLAAVVEQGLGVLDGEKAGARGGLVSLFDADRWRSRAELDEMVAFFDARSWTGVADDLRAPGEGLRVALEKLLEPPLATEVDTNTYWDQGTLDEQTVGLVPHEAVEAVEAVEDQVELIERLVAGDSPWHPDGLAGLTAQAEAFASRAASPGRERIPRALASRLPERLAESDVVLSSLPAIAANLGDAGTLNDDGFGLAEYQDRARAFAGAIGAIDGVVGHDDWWEVVDLYRLRAEYRERAGSPLPDAAYQAGDDIDEWINRAETWASAAVAVKAPSGGGRLVDDSRLRGDLAEINEKWSECIAKQGRATREALPSILVSVGEPDLDIRAELGLVTERLDELGRVPVWETLRAPAREVLDETADRFAVVERAVEMLYSRVMTPPLDLIAEWRAEPLVEGDAGLAWAGPISRLHDDVRAEVTGAWEEWFRGTGKSQEDVLDDPETDRLRVSRKGVAESLRRALDAIETGAAGVSVGGRFREDLIAPKVLQEMAERVGQSLGTAGADWGDERAAAPGGELDRHVEAAIRGVLDRVELLNDALEELGEVRDGLASFRLPGEAGERSAADVAGLLTRLDGDGLLPLLPTRPGAAPDTMDPGNPGHVAAVAEAVVGVSAVRDPDALMTLADSDGSPVIVRYAAVVQAGGLGEGQGRWPSSVGSMARDAERLNAAITEIEGALGGVEDGGRVRASIERVLYAWWSRGLALAGSDEQVGQLLAGPAGWFGQGLAGVFDPGGLTGDAACAVAVHGVRGRLRSMVDGAIARDGRAGGRAAKDRIAAELKQQVRSEIDRARGLGLPAGCMSWLGDLETVLAQFAGGRGVSWNPGEHGPGGAFGWQGTLLTESEPHRVEYQVPGGKVGPITFVLVEHGGTKSFVAEEEFSVGLLEPVVVALKNGGWAGKAGRVKTWLEREVQNRMRQTGPKGWGVSGRVGSLLRFTVASSWLDEADAKIGDKPGAVPAYAPALRDPNDLVRLRRDKRPTASHPVTRIPYSVADAIASSMGCGLPAQTAYQRIMPQSINAGDWNLRDQTVRLQLEHVDKAASGQINGQPITIYRPGDNCHGGDAGGAGVEGSDDSYLWFRTVDDPSGGSAFRNIIGNVAEFVGRPPGGGQPGVIGRSALSPPGRDASVPVACEPRSSYYDTGFRLAIPADDYGNLATDLLKQLEDSGSRAYASGGN